MPQSLLTCAKGHSWEPGEEDAALTQNGSDGCPICARDSGDSGHTLGHVPNGKTSDTSTDPTLVTRIGNIRDRAVDNAMTAPGSEIPMAAPVEMPIVAGYDIVDEVGRGGMGVVYRAKQKGLNRTVALKMVLGGNHADPKNLVRFKSEAEAVARLQHANIVQIYEVGEQEGRPYFSLEFVDGGSLADHLAGKAQAPRRAAEVVETLARALHVAHERGIIHRDLKPANVLLMQDGVLKITDFGLAKLVDNNSELTQSGMIVGTPSYMAPEQAGGKSSKVGPPADVYAMGAILYEMLTGLPPLRGETPLDTMLLIQTEEPIPPSRLQRSVPRDLETICLKCLEKEPRARYCSALELAAELRRFLNDETIQARPVGNMGRFLRWCRRNPTLAFVSGLAVAALFVALFAAVSLAIERNHAANEQAKANQELVREQAKTLQANEDLVREQAKTLQALNERRVYERISGNLALERGLAMCEQGDVYRGIHWLARSLAIYPDDAEHRRFVQASLASWGAQLHPLQLSLVHDEPVAALAVSLDGKLLAVGCARGVTLSDRRKKTTVQLYDARTGVPVGKPLEHELGISALAFSADNTMLAVGTEAEDRRGQEHRSLAYVWDVTTGNPIGKPMKQGFAGVAAIAFSPTGKRVLTACRDKSVSIWDSATGALTKEVVPGGEMVLCAAFSPDGKYVCSGGPDGMVRVWDLETGRVVIVDKPDRPKGKKEIQLVFKHPSPVTAVAFSADSSMIFTGCRERDSEERVGRIWKLDSDTDMGVRLPHTRAITAAVFSPNGKYLLTGTDDGFGRLWDVAKGLRVGVAVPQQAPIRGVAFTRDSQGFFTGSGDKSTKLWNINRDMSPPTRWPHPAPVTAVAISSDGKLIMTGSEDGKARIWDRTGTDAEQFSLPHQNRVTSVAFSANGKLAATGTWDGMACVWDTSTGTLRTGPLSHNLKHVLGVRISKDAETLWTCSSARVYLWDLADTELEGQLLPMAEQNVFRVFAVSPDDRFVLLARENGQVTVLDSRTGERRYSLPHERLVGASFSPDGSSVLTATQARVVLRNLSTGEPVFEPIIHASAVVSVAFSPDGKSFVTTSENGAVQLWDATTGRPLGAPFLHAKRVSAVAFSPDGKALLTGCKDYSAYLWTIPPAWKGELDHIVRRLQAISGLELDIKGTIHEMPPEKWEQLRKSRAKS